MASKVLVLAVVLSLVGAASLQQQPRVEMGETVEGRNSKTYNIRVECPNHCNDTIPFELDCGGGTLSTLCRPTDEILNRVEEKLRALESLLVPSSWVPSERRDITSRMFSLDEKIRRLMEALSGQI